MCPMLSVAQDHLTCMQNTNMTTHPVSTPPPQTAGTAVTGKRYGRRDHSGKREIQILITDFLDLLKQDEYSACDKDYKNHQNVR